MKRRVLALVGVSLLFISIVLFQNMTSTLAPCEFRDSVFGVIEMARTDGQSCEVVCNRERNSRQKRVYNRENESIEIRNVLDNLEDRFLPVSCKFKGGGKVPLGRDYIAVVNKVGRGVNIPLSELSPLSDLDIRFLSDFNLKNIRQRINPVKLFNGDFTDINMKELELLKKRLDLLSSHGFNVIVDFHRNNFEHSLKTEEGRGKLVEAWASLAKSLSHYDKNVYFELLNEPVLSGQWWALQKIIISKIREISPERVIVVSGDNYSDYSQLTGRSKLEQLIKINARTADELNREQSVITYSVGDNDPNVIYNFHFYNPMIFTHQGADFGGASSFTSRLKNVPWPISEDHAKCLRILSGDNTVSDIHRFNVTDPAKIEGSNHLFRFCSTKDSSSEPIVFKSHIVTMRGKLPDACVPLVASVRPVKDQSSKEVICTVTDSRNRIKKLPIVVDVYKDGAKSGFRSLDKAYLENAIKQVSLWANDRKVKLMVNEFGVFKAADVESKKRYYKDVTGLFDKYGVDWYIWEYRYDNGFGFAVLDEKTKQIREREEGVLESLGLRENN